jgi:hypothetical protein
LKGDVCDWLDTGGTGEELERWRAIRPRAVHSVI